MHQHELIDRLKEVTRASGVYEVRTFRAHRSRPNGDHQDLTIEIWDAGPAGGDARWIVEARDSNRQDGPVAMCNPAGSLAIAITTTHWQHLDAE